MWGLHRELLLCIQNPTSARALSYNNLLSTARMPRRGSVDGSTQSIPDDEERIQTVYTTVSAMVFSIITVTCSNS